MTLTQLLASQLADPFRIVLIIGLFVTMLRTREATGTWVPLAGGAVFVAVIIPSIMSRGGGVPQWQQMAVGAVANVILIGVVMAAMGIYERFKR